MLEMEVEEVVEVLMVGDGGMLVEGVEVEVMGEGTGDEKRCLS